VSAKLALLRSVENATRVPALLVGRELAAAAVADVAAMLQYGRTPVLCALSDALRILNASQAATKASSDQPQATKRQTQSSMKRKLKMGCRKLTFMLSWANEVQASEYTALHELAAKEVLHHR